MLAGSFVSSVLVHLIVSVPLRDFVNNYLSSAQKSDEPVKVVRVSPQVWDQNRKFRGKRPKISSSSQDKRKQTPAPKKQKPKPPPEKKKNNKLNGQIVEVPPTKDDSPNPEAKFLSKYNSNVKKQSVARPEDRDHSLKRVTNKLQRRSTSGSQSAKKTAGLTVKGDGVEQDSPGKPGETKSAKAGKQKFKLEVPDLVKQDELKLKLSDLPGLSQQRMANRTGSEALKGNSDRFNMQLGEGLNENGGDSGGKKGDRNAKSDKKGIPDLAALVPTIGTIARISGSPSRDHVDGVAEGDGTFLNTKEFKYATFFYRLRDSVAAHWEDLAAREYRRRDPTGNIYGVRDRSTLLNVRLTRDGRLDAVRVERTSGVDFLDDVAIQAFKMAQPFPNPPTGIVDADGHIQFNFQFVVTMRSRSPLNIFKFR